MLEINRQDTTEPADMLRPAASLPETSLTDPSFADSSVTGAGSNFGSVGLARQIARLGSLVPLIAFASVLALGLSVVFYQLDTRWASLIAGSLGGTLAFLTILALIWRVFAGDKNTLQNSIAILGDDPQPTLVTDIQGQTLAANAACDGGVDPLERLAPWCVDPGRIVASILLEAGRKSSVTRIFRRPSEQLRVSVFRSDDHLVWRFQQDISRSKRLADDLGLPMLTRDAGSLVPNQAARDQLPEALLKSLAAEANRPQVTRLSFLDPHFLPNGTQIQPVSVAAHDGLSDILIFPAQAGLAAVGQHEDLAQGSDFETIPVALLTLAPDGSLLGTNRLARSLLGLGQGEERYFWDIVEGLGRPVSDWLDDARAGRALGRPEVLRASLTPDETFVQIILRRAEDPLGSENLVAVVSDATELKSLEARFVQSQKMQAIGQLAGGVAHDFNNLLTAISGHCDLLLLNRDRFDPDYDDLLQIHQNANRAAALVRQLLAFSRKQTLKPEVFQLESLLEDLTHLLTRLVGERITLNLSHDPSIHAIRADRRQLEQVIMNLVVNARDAMPMGGTIHVRTELKTLEAEMEIGRARVPSGKYAVIQVIDNGIGIPASIVEKIFEPFFTTKRMGEGTGLGLSTAYGIVKQMGGFIFVETEEGTGTTFSLYFASHDDVTELSSVDQDLLAPKGVSPTKTAMAAPSQIERGQDDMVDSQKGPSDQVEPAVRDQVSDAVERATPSQSGKALLTTAESTFTPSSPNLAPHAEPTGQPLPAPPKKTEQTPKTEVVQPVQVDLQPVGAGTILLVEDEAPVRAFAARALRLKGFQVFEAHDGEQALEFLDTFKGHIDLFVTDVVMPGIDGPGWVTQALATRPETPVVFMSGYAEDALTAQLVRIPRASFLGKPFSLQQMSEALEAQLTRS